MVMVGELVASAVVDGLLSKLGSGLWSELGLLWNFNDDLEDMKNTLESIEAVLNDAEKRSWKEKSVRLWLKRLKAAAYDMEDMLDELPTQNRLLYFPIMAHKVKGMKKRLDNIAEERSRYNLIKEEAISYEKEIIEERKTSSVVFKDDVLGRDQEATQIINRLLMSTTTNGSTGLSIIPIVGIGGLGKTTLAKLIHNDDRIKEVFKLRIWVHAVNLEVEKLVEAILSSPEAENRNFDYKITRAKEILQGKRYLIVLDDVWSEDWQKWDAFKQILLCGGKRESKIIVTTRSDRVPSIMGAETTHWLKPLSDDVCLELFERRAFGSAGAKDNHLASIGEEIVKKCRGVPLTANALGGMLHFEKGEAAWKKVRDSDLWELKEEEGGSSSENKIISSLKLSYQQMPSSLKLCFVYCSSYPRAFKLNKDMLIQQWIAQRFIQTEDEIEALQIGDSYVNYLLSMSFLEEEIEGSTYMKMHDLVYDLARSVAGNEVSVLDATESGKANAMECRYASVIKSNGLSNELGKALPQKVRALHFQDCTSLPKGIFSYTKCLRVLDFTDCSLDEVPSSVYKLKQLRYLRLPDHLKEVDEQIGKLKTLERLIISNSPAIRTLPTSIGKLHNLIYLAIVYANELSEIPYSIGSLQKLNILKLVGCNMLRSLPESLGNLMKLAILTIYNCEALTILPESLGNIVKLETLDIRQCSRLERIPKSLGNVVKLETLTIYNCEALTSLPESLGNVVKLETLTIYYCKALTSLPESLGNLVKLKTLDIRQCSRLERIPELLGNLVKLEILDIRQCSRLGRIPESLGNFVKLTTLTIYNCEALTSLPKSLSNLVKLETLDIRQCSRLERIPESLGNLVKLTTLIINNCEALTSLPESLGNLAKLKTLDVRQCSRLERIPESLGNLVKLETLTIYNCIAITNLPEDLSNAANLKTLDIRKWPNFTLPVSIGKLHNLIDLDLSFSDKLMELPDSIGELQKLYSLKLYGCDNLGSLPESLSNLTELRTLDIQGCAMLDLDELPKVICNMRHLKIQKIQRDETLELFEFDTSDLMLHLIYGPQGGHVLHHVTDAKRINLKKRGGSIKSLTYQCGAAYKKRRLVEAMLEALQPHQNLQELCIVLYEGSMFPSWMSDHMESFLPNLVKITLKKISNCEHLPVLGQLPKLEEIVIERMTIVRRISEEEFCGCGTRSTTAGASFRSLKRLELQNMDELEEWVTAAIAGDDGERGASPFPFLEDLTIWNCSKLKTIRPCIPSSVRRLSLSSIEHNLLTFVDVSNRIKYLQIQNYDLAHFRPSIRRLSSLETLKLERCIRLTTFPEWLGELCQLQHLDIHQCPFIDRLPQSIQGLTALTRLCITGCRPSLLERTRKGTGEDWDKISHIDNIKITR